MPVWIVRVGDPFTRVVITRVAGEAILRVGMEGNSSDGVVDLAKEGDGGHFAGKGEGKNERAGSYRGSG